MKYYIPTGDWHISTGYAYAHRLMQNLGSTEGDAGNYDVLVLPGGADIGAVEKRDSFEFDALEEARRNGKKVFGICRGMQVMLYVTGVNIIDHIPDIENTLEHRTLTGNWKGQSSWHSTKLGLLVNSRHHQGSRGDFGHWEVLDETVDGIAEAVCSKNQFGVQWHPEHPEMEGTPALEWLKAELKKRDFI